MIYILLTTSLMIPLLPSVLQEITDMAADVTKKSIEEIAATVLEYFKIFKKNNNDKQ